MMCMPATFALLICIKCTQLLMQANLESVVGVAFLVVVQLSCVRTYSRLRIELHHCVLPWAVMVCSFSPSIYAQVECFLMRRNCICNSQKLAEAAAGSKQETGLEWLHTLRRQSHARLIVPLPLLPGCSPDYSSSKGFHRCM
jgi:hypothetical protein